MSPYLVGSLDCSCRFKIFLSRLGALVGPVQNIFFFKVNYINAFVRHRSNQDYWKGMNKTGWKREIVGMRQMTSQFANIPVDQITGGYASSTWYWILSSQYLVPAL
jgi:hypothetical protein